MTELITVDPGTLTIGANVRIDTKLDKPFLESIAEHGVKQPIQAYRNDDGNLVVVAGQRRTLAAVQAALPTVKVEVIDTPDDADRIVDQMTENEHRTEMTNGDRMRAFAQLSLLGVPAAAIAKKTGHKQAVIKAAITAAADTTAAAAVDEHELDLVDAAAIAEFSDEPQVAEQLISAAKHGNLKWSLQRIRDDRERKAVYTTAFDAAKATGVTMLTQRPDLYNGPVAALKDLTDGEKPLTPARHKKCPGHAGFIAEEYGAGAKVKMVLKFVCLEYKKHGHTATGYRATTATRDTSPEGKAERRGVIQGNRDWKTATGLRRAWLREFLAGRTAPPSAAGFVALSLAADSVVADARQKSNNAMAHYLFGLVDEPKNSGYEDREAFTDLTSKANEKRALMIALGLVLGAYEAALMGHEWRSTNYTSSKPAIRYLRYLQLLGYELAPIELRACGEAQETATDDGGKS